MFRAAESIQNGESNIQASAINPASARVQGPVQPPPSAGGLQVQDDAGAGENGGDRGLQGQTSEELGVEAVAGNGVNNRRSVQLGGLRNSVIVICNKLNVKFRSHGLFICLLY